MNTVFHTSNYSSMIVVEEVSVYNHMFIASSNIEYKHYLSPKDFKKAGIKDYRFFEKGKGEKNRYTGIGGFVVYDVIKKDYKNACFGITKTEAIGKFISKNFFFK